MLLLLHMYRKKPRDLYSSAACRMGLCFPDERLGWLVYEIQHLPIYIHSQATACKRGWLIYESGLSNELFFQTNISLAQT